jgi:type VI protein secretion system component VasK
MDPIVDVLLKNSVLGLLAGVGFYLFFRQLKITEKLQEQNLQQQVADTAAKVKLATAFEDLADTVRVIGDRNATGMNQCQTNVNTRFEKIDGMMDELRQEKAKEEGRREATNPRIRAPKKGTNE